MPFLPPRGGRPDGTHLQIPPLRLGPFASQTEKRPAESPVGITGQERSGPSNCIGTRSAGCQVKPAGKSAPPESVPLQRHSQKSRQDGGATREKADQKPSELLFAATWLLQLQRHFLSESSNHRDLFLQRRRRGTHLAQWGSTGNRGRKSSLPFAAPFPRALFSFVV